jgi:hypothetical protein
MTHPLERLLIYTDKNSIDEFEIPSAEYDELYELYITTKDDVLQDHHTSVDFFNEVFYYLTCIYANDDAAENINSYLYNGTSLYPSIPELENPQSKQELKQAQEYANMAQEASNYVMGFVWTILKKQKELPRHVRFFQIALEHALEDVYSDFDTFSKFVTKHNTKYSISFDIKPEFDFAMCFCAVQEWKDATDDFDQVVIEDIIRRFKTPDTRRTIVDEIRKALEDANQDPNSSPKVSMVSHRLKANNQFLDELLKQKEEEEKQAVELEKAIEQSKDERIKELENQISDLKDEKKDLEHDRDSWKRKYEHLVREINERNRKIREKQLHIEFRDLPGMEIINQLSHVGLIKIHRRQITSDAFEEILEWKGSKKLFGYFVERVADELSLRKSGKSGNIIWEPFMQSFVNAEDLRHEAASAISAMKKKGALAPDDADKIEEAIKYANAMAAQYKD